jgi:hypothetical protein
LSEEVQRQRIRELVRKKTGVDWPELRVGDIQKSMTSTTVFYWGTKEDIGKRWHHAIHPSAWKTSSTNFALTAFSEVAGY